jgi:hypothetical protein
MLTEDRANFIIRLRELSILSGKPLVARHSLFIPLSNLLGSKGADAV